MNCPYCNEEATTLGPDAITYCKDCEVILEEDNGSTCDTIDPGRRVGAYTGDSWMDL